MSGTAWWAETVADLAARGIAVDAPESKSVPAQEAQAPDGAETMPLPRVALVRSGIDGEDPDRFGPPVTTGGNPVSLMSRYRTYQVRIWGFGAGLDATPQEHRDATEIVVDEVLISLGDCLNLARETWQPKSGTFVNDAKDIEFGALYVLTIEVGHSVHKPARPTVIAPSNTTAQSKLSNGTTETGATGL